MFRYLLLYKVGGVYLDIKSTATRPLDAVLLPQDQFLLSEWNNDNDGYDVWGKHYELRGFGGREFQQWYIAASPGHPFLRSVIDNVLANIDTYIPGLHGTGKPGVLRTRWRSTGCWRSIRTGWSTASATWAWSTPS